MKVTEIILVYSFGVESNRDTKEMTDMNGK